MIIDKSKVLALEWYRNNKPIIEQLAIRVESTVKGILKAENISYHIVNSRVKEIGSFSNKIKNPKYTDPIKQIQDCVGIRIITYVESDLHRICALIESNFEIDKVNSIDKKKTLGVDKFGYMSVHYIAKFTNDKLCLPEFNDFKDFVFEIQIRTILQHAWAEIEHDKDYKVPKELKLPDELKRRFGVLAAVLELADREFNELTKAIDAFNRQPNLTKQQDNLLIPIDSISIKSYLDYKFEHLVKLGVINNFMSYKFEVNSIYELEKFGVSNLKELDDIIPNDIVTRYTKYIQVDDFKKYNYGGLIRDMMLIHNADNYFTNVWRNNWHNIYKDQLALISSYSDLINKYIENDKIKVI